MGFELMRLLCLQARYSIALVVCVFVAVGFTTFAQDDTPIQSITPQNVDSLTEIRVLSEHQLEVVEIAIDDDTNMLYSASRDGRVLVWDLSSDGVPEQRMSYDGLGTVAINLQHGLFAATCDDTPPLVDGICIVDLASGEELATISDSPGVGETKLSEDSRYLGIATWHTRVDSAAIIWEVGTSLEQVARFSQPPLFTQAIAFRPKTTQIAIGDDVKLTIHNLANSSKITSLEQHYPVAGGSLIMKVKELEYNRDGTLLASLGHDLSLWVWDAEIYDELFSVLSAWPIPEYAPDYDWPTIHFDLAFNHDGTLLAYTCEAGVCIVDMLVGDVVRTLEKRASSIAFSSDGLLLAIGGEDGDISVWGISQ